MLFTIAQWLVIVFPLSLLAGPAEAEILGGLISFLFLIHSARTGDWQWLRCPWVILLFSMCFMFVISGMLSSDPSVSAHRAALYIRYPLLAAALAFWALRDARTQQRSLLVMVVAMVLLAADMLLEYVHGTDIFGHRRIDMPGFVRLHGPFNKIHPGSTLVWIFFPALFFLLYRIQTRLVPGIKRSAAFLLTLLLCGFVVTMVHVSGERAAFLACVLGMALSILFANRLRWFFLLLAVMAGVAMVGIVHSKPQVLNMQLQRVTNDVSNFNDSVYGRLWRSAWNISKDHPWLGVGTKQFRHVCPRPEYGTTGRDDPVIRCGMHPHNIYLEILAETGIISLTLFLAAIGYWAWLVWSQRARVMNDPLLCGLVIACIIRLWPIAATPSHFTPWFASPLWFIVGFALARLAMTLNADEKAPR